MLIGIATIIVGGCAPSADAPNPTVAAAKDPEAIKVLAQIKALPDGPSRRQFMDTHEKETQVLHNDSGAWFEASKLAWEDPSIKPTTMDTASKKGK